MSTNATDAAISLELVGSGSNVDANGCVQLLLPASMCPEWTPAGWRWWALSDGRWYVYEDADE